MNIRDKCPICEKDVSISLYMIIHRHKSNIKQLNGAICPASGRYFASVKLEEARRRGIK